MIELILALRDHELQREAVKQNLNALKQAIKDLLDRQAGLSRAVEESQKLVKDRQLSVKKLESELSRLDLELKKLNQQRNEATTEKALANIDGRITQARATQAQIEETWLLESEVLEEVKSRLEDKIREVSQFEKILDPKLAELNSGQVQAQKLLLNLENQAEGYLEGLGLEFVRMHQVARKAVKRECVILALNGESCPNCGMMIPQNVFLGVRYQQQAMSCPSCQVILVHIDA